MKSILFTSVVSIFFSLSLFGQPIQLTPLNGPGGGIISKFHLNTQGDILAAQDHVGIRISRDGGNTWLTLNGSFGSRGLTDHPDGSFYGTGTFSTTLYRIPPTSTETEIIEFDSLNNSALNNFAIDEHGIFYGVTYDDEIFRSHDNGKTWTFLRKGGWNISSGFQEIYAPPGDHIYFKVKGGAFLQELIYRMRKDNFEFDLSYNSMNDRIYTFCENPSGGYFFNNLSGVYSSPDGSPGSWTKISSGFQTVALACASNGDLTVAALSGYFRSTDSGATWTQLPGSDVNQYVGAVSMDYDDVRGKYYVRNQSADLFNFYQVEPDFSNWAPLAPEDKHPPVHEVLTDGAGNVYAGTAISLGSETEGYHRSEDNGNIFSPYRLPNGSEIRAISEGANDVLFAFGYNDSIYRSQDYGTTWALTQPDSIEFNPQGNNRFSYVTADKNGTVLANFENALGGRLWMSEDNGLTWSKLDFRHYYQNYIDIHPNGDIYGTPYSNGGGKLILKYDRQVQRWDTLMNYSSTLREVHVSASGVIYVKSNSSSNPGWLISEDEGSTFHLAPWSNINYLTSASNGYLYAVQRDKIVNSKNNGLSWEVIYTHTGAGNFRDIHIDKNNILYAGFHGNFIHKSDQLIFEDNFIAGHVFYDKNENCVYDSSEVYLKDIIVSAEGLDTFYVTTRHDGKFIIPVPEGGYNVSISLDGDLWMPCDSLQPVSLTGINDTAFIDFPVKPKVLCPKLSVDISTPLFRRCFTNTYYVNFCNDGTVSADDAHAEIILDPRMTITSSQVPWTNPSGNNYIFNLGDIDIFSCGKFNFTVEHDCDQVDLGETICVEAHIFPDTICTPPDANWSRASLDISVECEGDSAIFKIKNVGTGDMIVPRKYIIIEDFVIMRISAPFQLDAGGELRIPVETMGSTFHLETQQVNGHPGISQPSATIERCGVPPHSLGFFNQYGQNDANSNIDIECREVIGAYDPNDKNAVPTGRDTEHFIQPEKQIEYLIRFQNTGTDTAFTVRIFDTLSQNLDIKTFKAVNASHDFDFEITARGIVKFEFKNIMLPDSNVNQVASNGFVKYKIEMKPGLQPLTEIHNSADIYFDYNAPIRTNTTLHTIEEEWILVKAAEVFLPKSDVKVFPNPFSETATLELNSEIYSGEFTCRIFDINGRLISSQLSENQKIIISGEKLPTGIYFYKVAGMKGKKIATGKIIVTP